MPVLTAQGPLPEQLGALSHLQSLNLSSNELTGSLPVSIGQLQIESGVWLDHNQLSGSIPQAWCSASVTSAVHVDHNAGLYGAVPQCLQGRLRQGSSYAGTGLIQVDNSIEASSSSSGGSGGSSNSSGSSYSGSSSSAVGGSGSGAEAPICSSTSCGSVCLLHALGAHHPPSIDCQDLVTKLAAISFSQLMQSLPLHPAHVWIPCSSLHLYSWQQTVLCCCVSVQLNTSAGSIQWPGCAVTQ